ncbi:uncharacterized protein J3D65DRAFT_666718 [Phyllosticta citribraziliensis]|uniref:Uncharacterized protein n=1 Tax=Phyllosticta citribraziliensis TaxID=989973 RepID=A0ABR1LZW6_9PEZI
MAVSGAKGVVESWMLLIEPQHAGVVQWTNAAGRKTAVWPAWTKSWLRQDWSGNVDEPSEARKATIAAWYAQPMRYAEGTMFADLARAMNGDDLGRPSRTQQQQQQQQQQDLSTSPPPPPPPPRQSSANNTERHFRGRLARNDFASPLERMGYERLVRERISSELANLVPRLARRETVGGGGGGAAQRREQTLEDEITASIRNIMRVLVMEL